MIVLYTLHVRSIHIFIFVLSVHVRVCIQLYSVHKKFLASSFIFWLANFPFCIYSSTILYGVQCTLKNLVSCDGRHLFPCCRSHQLLAGRFESIGFSPSAVNCCCFRGFLVSQIFSVSCRISRILYFRDVSMAAMWKGQPSTGKSTVANRLLVARCRQFCLKKNENWYYLNWSAKQRMFSC